MCIFLGIFADASFARRGKKFKVKNKNKINFFIVI